MPAPPPPSSPAELLLPLDQLPDPLPIRPIERPFDVTITPPGSKSLTNRALLLAALADGTSTLTNALTDADDAQVMIRALRQLGAVIEADPAKPTTLRITGVGGRWKLAPGQTVTLNLNNAGTATRFLTAAAMLAPPGTSIVIDGDERMRERPIAELSDALRRLGIEVAHLAKPDCPPLSVTSPSADAELADRVEFGRTASSQFISAMMMALPFLGRDVGIVLTESPTSESYVWMTRQVMEDVGFEFHRFTKRDPRSFRTTLSDHRLPAFSYAIEPDASGATYFLAAAALIPNARCIIGGLPWVAHGEPLQGDTWFGGVLHAAGVDERADATSTEANGPPALSPFEWDFSDMPDTAMTAAVIACFARPTPDNPTATSTLRGLRTLRVKETDRLAALQTELTKLGAIVETFADGNDEGLRISPPTSDVTLQSDVNAVHSAALPLCRSAPSISFDTYNDHRMAMALALVGLRRPNVFIQNPACVAKTYPGFWRDFAKLYG